MQIIETRWRDIALDDLMKCLKPSSRPGLPAETSRAASAWETKYRGKPLRVVAPPCAHHHSEAACDGPFYRVVDGNYCVCIHVAEIGD